MHFINYEKAMHGVNVEQTVKLKSMKHFYIICQGSLVYYIVGIYPVEAGGDFN